MPKQKAFRLIDENDQEIGSILFTSDLVELIRKGKPTIELDYSLDKSEDFHHFTLVFKPVIVSN